jgi:hypothetical protein
MANLTHEIHPDETKDAIGDADMKLVDMKIEVVVIPVSDVDRAKEFYKKLGWRLGCYASRGCAVHAAGVMVLGSIRRDAHRGCARSSLTS